MNETKYQVWISEARNDYKTAKLLFCFRRYNFAVFHFSQSAEKAIKALLHYLGEDPWGHEILNLFLAYEQKGYPVDEKIKRNAKDLEKEYFESRYPETSLTIGPSARFSRNDAKDLKVKALEILQYIEKEKERIDGKH